MSDNYFVFGNGVPLHTNLKRAIKFVRTELKWKEVTKHVKLNSHTNVLIDEAKKLKPLLIKECVDKHGANEYVQLATYRLINCDEDSITIQCQYFPSENWDELNMFQLMGLAKYGYYMHTFSERPYYALTCEYEEYYDRHIKIEQKYRV
jgi:hypothetical protein